MDLAPAEAPLASSARDYERNSLRLALLRETVPATEKALHALLSVQFGQSLQEFTVLGSERALESLPVRVTPELLNWARRQDVDVAVPAAWLAANGARFIAGCTHRRETLALLLSCWTARRELSALEACAPPPPPQLLVVDFRRMDGPAAALAGPIPVCSLDGTEQRSIGTRHAARMRARSPRLADALRIGLANHEYWREQGASGSAERAAFVDSAGATSCRSMVYFLDTYACDSPHRPGAMASQVYVGLVGTHGGEAAQAQNTLAKRFAQHLAGEDLLVDIELKNPALWRPGTVQARDHSEDDMSTEDQDPEVEVGPTPAVLLLALDFGTPGLHGRDSVGFLEGVYTRYFDCVSPLGLNATRSRGERAFNAVAWDLFVARNTDGIAAALAAGAPTPFLMDPTAAPPLPRQLMDSLQSGKRVAYWHEKLAEYIVQHGDIPVHSELPGDVTGVPFQQLLDRSIELNIICLDTYKTTARQQALHGGSAESLLRGQRTGAGAAANTDLIHDCPGVGGSFNGNYAFWHRATHAGWSLTRPLFPRNPRMVTDTQIAAAIEEARAAREEREGVGAEAGGKRARGAGRGRQGGKEK